MAKVTPPAPRGSYRLATGGPALDRGSANIALTLAFLGDPRAIEALEASYDRQPDGVIWISAGLASIKDARVIPVLEKILASPSQIAQECSRRALQKVRGEDI